MGASDEGPLGDEPGPRALIVWAVAVSVTAAAIVWALYLARRAIVLVYVSALLAIGLGPVVRRIERLPYLRIGKRRPPRWAAVLAIYLAVLAIIAAVGITVLPPLVRQAHAFVSNLPKMVDQAERSLVARGLLAERQTLGEMVQQAPPGTDTVATLLTTIWGFFGGVLGLLTILILTFYLLVDADGIFLAVVRLFPRHRRLQLRSASDRISAKVSAWLNGQLIVAVSMGAATAIELGALGMPYFFVLAVIAALGEFIPYLGPILAAMPGIAVALTISGRLALLVAGLYFVNQQLESQILVPKIMERQVGLSPVAVIVALLVGGALFGIVGAILAVPTAAVAQVAFYELLPEEQEPETGVDPAGRLP